MVDQFVVKIPVYLGILTFLSLFDPININDYPALIKQFVLLLLSHQLKVHFLRSLSIGVKNLVVALFFHNIFFISVPSFLVFNVHEVVHSENYQFYIGHLLQPVEQQIGLRFLHHDYLLHPIMHIAFHYRYLETL